MYITLGITSNNTSGQSETQVEIIHPDNTAPNTNKNWRLRIDADGALCIEVRKNGLWAQKDKFVR